MYGMPLSQALVFVAPSSLIIGAARRIHPFIVLMVVAAAFGALPAYPTSFLGSVFGSGFSEMIYSPGLVIVAAALLPALPKARQPSAQLSDCYRAAAPFAGNRIAAAVGLFAGVGASPASAFALLTPLLPAIGGRQHERQAPLSPWRSRSRQATGAVADAGADRGSGHSRRAMEPRRVVRRATGRLAWRFRRAVCAMVVACRWPCRGKLSRTRAGAAWQRTARVVLILAIAVPLLLLMVQSLGDMPSEPLGGGPTRELIIGIGRPLILFLAGVGIMIIGKPRTELQPPRRSRMDARHQHVSQAFCSSCAPPAACSGSARKPAWRKCSASASSAGTRRIWRAGRVPDRGRDQDTARLVAGRGYHRRRHDATAIAVARTSRYHGKALAALAIGAGAMTVSHVNDEYFWLVADRAGLTPPRGLAALQPAARCCKGYGRGLAGRDIARDRSI